MKHAQRAVKKTSKSFASFLRGKRPSHGLGKRERGSRVYRWTAKFRSRQSMPRSVLIDVRDAASDSSCRDGERSVIRAESVQGSLAKLRFRAEEGIGDICFRDQAAQIRVRQGVAEAWDADFFRKRYLLNPWTKHPRNLTFRSHAARSLSVLCPSSAQSAQKSRNHKNYHYYAALKSP